MIKEILLLFTSILMGVFGAYKTNWEREIYRNYFKWMIPLILIFAAILFFIDKKISLVTIYIAIMLISWKYSTKYFKKRK